MADEENERKPTWLERNLQTMVMAALGGICSWMAFTTQGLTVQMATMNEKVSYLQEQLKSAAEDRYHAADANRDFALRDNQIGDLRDRVSVLEKQARH